MQPAIDENKLNDLLGRAIVDFGAVSLAPLVLIGDRLGLYRALGDEGPLTSAELAVHTGQVKVTAGGTTALNSITITGDPSTARTLWRLGDWDGTPRGFKNAELMTYAHPSDGRAARWTGDVTLGSGDPTATFPAYLWRDVNDGVRVYFKLTAAQAAAAHTLRIGVTDAFSNGRPRVSVNEWVSAIPAAPKQPSTRSLTTGSYRGNNHTFTFSVPAGMWSPT